jgi:hypothetical protein
MQANISYQIWFKVCRPFRHKYSLSTNCLLVLNGVYVLSIVKGNSFTRRSVLTFVSYYNHSSIGTYLTVLISHNFIIKSGANRRGNILYSLSPLGLQVISELNDSYDKQLVLFCSKYNIEL